ncbi:MAG: GNAT family N-acetyltransferase [Flavobacteriales bacterium]|nr:GNAT family N-acetyltransferase [Flavobacteriales bacterium]MCB9193121.1 GNAT family N-acetyltransferase [Flavobacteriales bacterium]
MILIPIPQQGPPDEAPVPITANVREWIDGNQAFYKVVGFAPPWVAYLAREHDAIVGTCAFKGAPKEGIVEIAYATRPDKEGRGIATWMAVELVRIARSTDPALRIIAQTLPEPNASTRVLAKCGFVQVRDAMDDEVGTVWEWELPA